MRIHLDQVVVDLASDNNHLIAEWERLFEGWLTTSNPSPPAIIRLTLQACRQLPALPPDPPFFRDNLLPDGSGILSVYRQPQNHVLLHFLDGALVGVPLDPLADNKNPEAHGKVTAQALQNGRFEDVTFTSLAPLLRRQGYFLVHAFAAARNGRCVLIVGATRSGKTTTGLNLLLNGWDLLSNDVVMLRHQAEGIYAYPTPGDVGIRRHTFNLLPQLATCLPSKYPTDQAINISGQQLINGRWAKPCIVNAIFLPKIITGNHSKVIPLPRAVCLAHLMQESIDRWDEPCLQAHINILQHLCKQVNTFSLNLGQDMAQVPKLISTYSR